MPAQLRQQQQTALGTSASDAGLKTQGGQSHTGSEADAYLQFLLRDIETGDAVQHMDQTN